MALSNFPQAVSSFVESAVVAANLCRSARDNTGPLRWADVEALTRRLGQVQGAYEGARVEALKSTTAAQAYIADLGGPATLAEFATAMAAVDTAIAALTTELENFIANQQPTAFMEVVSLHVGNGVNAQILQVKAFVPDASVAAFRGSSQLQNVITALEALGA